MPPANKCVFTSKLQLSHFPNFVNPTINIEHKKKYLAIAHYVLPKYGLTLGTDKHVTYKDAKILVTDLAQKVKQKFIFTEISLDLYYSILQFYGLSSI